MPSRFSPPFLQRRHLFVPGRRTVSLTRLRDAADGYPTDLTWGIFNCQKRPVSQAAMRLFSGYGIEQFDCMFVLPALSTPAEVKALVARGRGITGWVITEGDGTRWQVQACRTGLMESDYWAAVKQLQPANEVVQPVPAEPIGGDPDPTPAGDPPTVAITAVAPDPRANTVSTITFVFDKVVSGFTLSNLTLTRNAGADLLSGSQTVGTLDGMTWTLSGLASITGTNGTYLLTLTTTGIEDADGQELATGATESWVMNSAILTAAITAVSPDPRSTAVSSITIVFSAAVASGFTLADLTLKRNGGSNLLTGGQTLTTSDNITWTLGNLSGLTATAGTYVLLLTASGSGIQDGATNPLAADASETWTTDTTAPTCVVTPVTNDPRTQPVESIIFTFSEAMEVSGITIAGEDVTLTRDGGLNVLTGSQTLTTFDGIIWTLGNLTGVTTATGSYVLTVKTSCKDRAGNGLAAEATDSWITVAPTVAALPTSDDRMEAGIYTTSVFIPSGPGTGVPPPYPHRISGIVLSYNQTVINEDEVLTGLPSGVTKLNQNLDAFRTGCPQGLMCLEMTGSGLLSEEILNAYRGVGSAAGRYEGRGLFPVPGLMYDAATMTASRIRSDWGVKAFGTGPGQSIESKAYMDFRTPSNRAFWAQKVINHVTPYFQAPYVDAGGLPKYQALWMDEMSAPPIDSLSAPLVDTCSGYFAPIRDAIRAYGALLGSNISTTFQFDTASADALVDALDFLYVERMFTKDVICASTTALNTCISRMRRMWDRNPTGFAIWDQYGVDSADTDRECVIVAAANAPGGGMRLTLSTPHRLAYTALKLARVYSLTGFPSGYYACTAVTDTVMDVTTPAQYGTLTPTGSSYARFVHSDIEVGSAMMMIAARFTGRRKYVSYSPTYSPIEPYSWPALYGVPNGDYTIDNTNGSGAVTELHCNFSGGSRPPSRVTVYPQERWVKWETI